jgi:hypothetical protein
VGNRKRLSEGLIYCQDCDDENSSCQEGNDMRSLEDLIDCREGREETPYFQEGKREQMSPRESVMNSEVSSN